MTSSSHTRSAGINTSAPSNKATNHAIRRALISQRRQLRTKHQALAAQLCAKQLNALPCIKRARTLALYMPSGGEISPLNVSFRHKSVLLPKIHSNPLALANQALPHRQNIAFHKQTHPHQLHQQRMRPQRLLKHRWGMLEPVSKRLLPASNIDVIIMPLSAFNQAGERLGMGGGFYDSALACTQSSWRKKPILIGLAYDFQCNEAFETADWDIPCDLIATPTKLWRHKWRA